MYLHRLVEKNPHPFDPDPASKLHVLGAYTNFANRGTYKYIISSISNLMRYSKTCVKQPLKNRQNADLNDKW